MENIKENMAPTTATTTELLTAAWLLIGRPYIQVCADGTVILPDGLDESAAMLVTDVTSGRTVFLRTLRLRRLNGSSLASVPWVPTTDAPPRQSAPGIPPWRRGTYVRCDARYIE